ncbi:MAG: LysM peptidoglycan-binding domain-containing protein [Aminipila sp.]
MKNKRKSYRIKSKFRFITSITMTLILFIFVANTVFGLNSASSLTKYTPIQVEVRYGDSLWNIASEYGPKNADKREIIYEICSLNDITADSIYPGQTIFVPDYNN